MVIELEAMEGTLDEIQESLPSSRDQNSCTLRHNVAVTVMAEIGNDQAPSVVTQLLNDFLSIRLGLLMEIGGGVPDDEREDDIRREGVVVSKPMSTFGSVIPYDMGKSQGWRTVSTNGFIGKASCGTQCK